MKKTESNLLLIRNNNNFMDPMLNKPKLSKWDIVKYVLLGKKEKKKEYIYKKIKENNIKTDK
jgi:hypothetical protein